jgi:ABC-type bacteriocin/lantibiotic exporter with double-glycine peptidase domain
MPVADLARASKRSRRAGVGRAVRRRESAEPGGKPATPHPPRDLYRYIWRTSGRAQLLLALLSVGIFLLDLVPLELQRRIVNDAIGQRRFASLAWLCGVYAATALAQGLAKLTWNVYRNSVGEAASRRLRLDTFTAALRHPEPGTAAKEGVGISIILSEADSVGLFVATSVSEPVLHGGVLIAVFSYLVYLQPWMALVALALFLPQCVFVPMVQRAINRRTETRIRVLRRISVNIVAEAAQGVLEREANSYRRRVGEVYSLNMQIYRRKYSMNFLINLLYHLGTVGILLFGGWFVMQGRTEIGTVVAFISGLNKVNDPWHDLVAFFRDMTNARVKYRLIANALETEDPAEIAKAAASH